MARKYDLVSGLVEETMKELARSEDNWTSFLDTAARIYKYPFDEQMLIYAQRPDATAVASMEIWNEKMNCWVNKGSKGIALIDKDSVVPRLKYVFDVTDVHKARRIGRYPNIWHMEEQHQDAVMERLERVYGHTNPNNSFEDRLIEIAEGIANDYASEVVNDMQYQIEGTFLEGLDEQNVELRVRETLRSSIAYQLLSGCGLDTSSYMDELDFSYIRDFNTVEMLSQIGTNISELAKPVFLEVGRAIRTYEKNIVKKGLANDTNIDYNALKRESKNRSEEERGSGNEHRISEERGLHDSEYIDGRTAGSGVDEVRTDEKELSEGEQERNVQRSSSERKVNDTSNRDSETGGGEIRNNQQSDDDVRGSNGEPERTGSDALGAEDEQYPFISRGDRSDRDYLQLSLFPTEEQQKTAIEVGASEELAPFSVEEGREPTKYKYSYIAPKFEKDVPEEYIRQTLVRGSGFQDGKFRIERICKTEGNAKERVKAIRNEYGQGGAGWPIEGLGLHGYDSFHSKGLHFQWIDMDGEKEGYVSWNVVEKYISDLIKAEQYITPEQRAEYDHRKMVQAKFGLLKENDEISISGQSYRVIDPNNAGRIEVEPDDLSSEYHFTVGEDNFLPYYELYRHEFSVNGEVTEYAVPEADNSHKANVEENIESEEEFQEWEEADLENDDFNERLDALIAEKTEEFHATHPEYDHAEDTGEIEIDSEEKHVADTNATLEPVANMKEPQKQAVKHSIPENVQNYHINDNELGIGNAKDKFKNNISAIRTLQHIEEENRFATPEEQQILSNYVGWGGLSDAFDDSKSAWTSEYMELKGLLSEDEYKMARESTLNAHYTSPTIIQGIYDTLDNMGFEKGNILEPSCGVGNFFGMLPEKMSGSRLYGVELDSLTGRMAKQLYPRADIKITGFEKTDYPNDFFDVAIGNVPFGQYKVSDRAYDKNNFLIHDYFMAKSLDKVRPGGVVAFITSKGTMDKKSSEVRKYFAQRADLIGAVRLPNTAFKANAGTEVTSDILFLQKRDRVLDIEPEWVNLKENEDGIMVNQYFAEHPEMVVGKMEMVSGPYGMEATCVADIDRPFKEQLQESLRHINGQYEAVEIEEPEDDLEYSAIPADPDVKNYSYTVVDDKVYYRENSIMKPATVSDTMQERIKGMVAIRNCTQELINYQLEEYSDHAIGAKQAELNILYDKFSKKFGLINSQTNKRAFNQDSSYCLLCSLEKLNDDGTLKGKADMFSKRTIKKAEIVTSVDTASEALTVSLGEKAKVDLDYMADLTGKTQDEITEDLSGVIFLNPTKDRWETADEYLSGNVREKLEIAKVFAENHPEYAINVAALERVQPKLLEASDIEVRIGATWIDPKYINDFLRDVFQTPEYLLRRENIGIQYSDVTGQWNVKGKSADYNNPITSMTYGTTRANAYKILEDSLNLKDTRIFDTVYEDGKETRVLNKKETMLASQKQEAIREEFKNWVFKEPQRREALCTRYNELFNSTRPREFDGEHLKFPGMTPEITLKPHQKNAVAHVLYGDNTMLAHCVGAGKTFEMAASAMEMKRLGISQKSLFVVPNHLTEQWGSDFLRLYPGANILVATKKDFEPANRKKFCARIATGDYDAVIMGHTQFEKIPLSAERQIAIVERQIQEITSEIADAKANNGERYTIKQMEKTKKTLQTRLDKLNDSSRKDDVVTFEQLGCDRLFVDESHSYKNLFLYTKMRNVAGIAQTEAQKSSDMFAKCQYLDELTGGKGITFATGTPISNSMTELYTNMRYLQYNTLQRLGLGHFDSWASAFGETQTAIELAPEGTGYRAKTRFAKFFNLPELISLFKESADIQTPDMLKLPVPEVEYHNEVLKPSEHQKDMVSSLADRAERVRNREVDATVDNMLKITNDGRKLALDQRLTNDMLPDNADSKANKCVENAFKIWEDTAEKKSAQLIFCDLSTPKGDGTFNVYEDIRDKLVAKGVPTEEIAFIHDANTENRKAELFAKVRSGQVRFLMGSTAKMGAGTNVQDKLVALHHMDVPWRPSDIEQQEGRILRQGNENAKVDIFRYVTEGTFDSYSWQLIENKQKFIGQIMTSKSPVRSCEDIDEAALSYAEVKALATGNPYIKEKMDLDIQVSKLKLLKANHTSQIYRLEDNITKNYPQQINTIRERVQGYKIDIDHYESVKPVDKDAFIMKIGDKTFADKKEAGATLIDTCRNMKTPNVAQQIGEYLGFKMSAMFDSFDRKFSVILKGALSHKVEIGADELGNLTRINNALEAMSGNLAKNEENLANVTKQLENAKIEVTKPFPQEEALAEKLDRLSELNALLNMDEKGEDAEVSEEEEVSEDDIAESEKEQSEEHPTDMVQPVAMFTMSQRISEIQGEKQTAYGDKPRQRFSVADKLAEMKAKANALNGKAAPEKGIGKEETL